VQSRWSVRRGRKAIDRWISRQLARQLYTLGFAAGKRRGGLTKPQITKPHLTQRVQAIVNRRNIIERSSASSTVKSNKSAMLKPLYLTSKVSRL